LSDVAIESGSSRARRCRALRVGGGECRDEKRHESRKHEAAKHSKDVSFFGKH